MKLVEIIRKCFFIKTQRKGVSEDNRKYALWVTTFDGEGYSSRLYNWSQEWRMSYEEACKITEDIKDRFYDVEIVGESDLIIRQE